MRPHRLGLLRDRRRSAAPWPARSPSARARTRGGARGARILLGQHLRQNAVAQAQRRVAKARQPEALQQLRIDLRAGHDDLRAARPDARHRLALRQRHLGELRGQLAHQLRGRNARHAGCRPFARCSPRAVRCVRACRRSLADLLTGRACIGQRRRRARSGNHQRHALRLNAAGARAAVRAQSAAASAPGPRAAPDRADRNSSVSRTAPSGRLIVSLMRLLFRERDLAASPAQVDQQHAARLRPARRLSRRDESAGLLRGRR